MASLSLPLLLLLITFHIVQSLPPPPLPGTPPNHTALPTKDGDIYKINRDSGLNLFEGDIIKTPTTRNAIVGTQYKWPLVVPYYLDSSLDLNAKGVILKALERYRLKSCIDFKPWTGETNYIFVFKGQGCYSYIGKQSGRQVLSIGPGCDTVEIVQHEFLHSLGFFHEQSRTDRNDYVTVAWENVQAGYESNFNYYDATVLQTLGVAYDYTSVMHYSNTAFSSNGRPTLITRNALFTNIIGNQMDFSANDVLKLNRLYQCTSSLTFKFTCNFDSDAVCAMIQSTDDNKDWLRVNRVAPGAVADPIRGYFMYFDTSTGISGYKAGLESKLFYPTRQYQCLEFFYYNSGSDTDVLNIWIKQYTPLYPSGIMTLVDTIRGKPDASWQLRYTPLSATTTFRIVFQGVKGSGASSGGFSIDDINLSETVCPQNVWQIKGFTQSLTQTPLYSPPFYSKDGYAYQIALWSYATVSSSYNLAAYVFLISGANDKTLQWPCLWKQVTVEFMDQNSDVQQRTSNMKSITTDNTIVASTLRYTWNNPLYPVYKQTFPNGTKYNATGGIGALVFPNQDWLLRREFIKGGNAFILVSFEDISKLKTSQTLYSPNKASDPLPSFNGSPIQSSEIAASSSDGCAGYVCYNGGTCFEEDQTPKCRCDLEFAGERCESVFYNGASAWTTPFLTTLLMLVLVVMMSN